MIARLIDLHLFAAHTPLALVLAQICGALIRAAIGGRWPRTLGTAAASIFLTLTLWSWLAPVNAYLQVALMLVGLAAAIGAALAAPKRLLLIEPLAFPICLVPVVTVSSWF